MFYTVLIVLSCILILDILLNKETPVNPVASNGTAVEHSVSSGSRAGKMLPMHIR